ncbi:MAG: methyl-accepting chemotaxis sensory transducer [Proteobacteria bacterium]|nr:methyl-accepting chemotaxis sensory transducer [Pseudomonadota bacterium]
MDIFADWWRRLGLQTKLQLLIQGFLLILLLAAQQWIFHQFEHQLLNAAKERAMAVADGAINGLNTLMIIKAGADEVISNPKSRAQFIEKMGKSESVKEMRVVRGQGIDDEFDGGMPQERPVDDMDRRVLASGVSESALISQGDDAWLRMVVPYVARKNFRTINCLECHGVEEGAVVGAASVTIDIKEDRNTIERINVGMWAGQAVLQVLLFLVVGFIVRRLLRQLGGEPAYVIDIIRQIAHGNLSGTIVTRNNDSDSLLLTTQQMQSSLRRMIGGILATAEQLAQAARQLAGSSQQVELASERQSDSSAAVASSVEEMTVCIAQISENAAGAQRHASATGQLAKSGASAVSGVIAEMDRIAGAVSSSSQLIATLGERSHEISGIVKVIKEIADQTNLLALNAAIEAARAGEQGRGFAVVADEVRKLAERTTKSTQEIAAMIEAIQGGTDAAVAGMAEGSSLVVEGVEMVSHTGASMEKIQEGVHQVLAAVDDISSALKEQSSASHLITRNVEDIAEMTGETSHIIKQVAASAGQLEQLASHLKASVSEFKL